MLLVVAGILLRDSLSSPANQLSSGDCFDDPPTDSIVLTIQHRPCLGPHDAEVILVRSLTGDAFPSVDVIESLVVNACIPAFEDVLGTPFESETEHDLGYLAPTELSWRQGDHEVACYVYRLDGQPMETPLRPD